MCFMHFPRFAVVFYGYRFTISVRCRRRALTYRGVLPLAMTLQDISLAVTDVPAWFLPRQQQALFYYRHRAQILEWSLVFRPHNMWLHGIYSAPAVVTPFPIGLSRDRAKCQSVALKERSSEGQDEEEG